MRSGRQHGPSPRSNEHSAYAAAVSFYNHSINSPRTFGHAHAVFNGVEDAVGELEHLAGREIPMG
jgi:hypothetical protein